MATKKTSNSKPTSKKPSLKAPPVNIEVSSRRRLKQPKYKSFRLSKRAKSKKLSLSTSSTLLKRSFVVIKTHWKVLLGTILIFAVLNVIMVRGFGGGVSLTDLKNTLRRETHASNLSYAATTLNYLASTIGSSSGAAGGTYQTILIIIVSLALIWALRQLIAGEDIGIRDGFYKGLYPLVPFILVLGVVSLQMLPFIAGTWLYTVVVNSGVAINSFEKFATLLISSLLSLLSLYMVSSSIFGLYIVTLPDVTPMKALRSARQLVLHRRWMVLRKVLYLPLVLFIGGGLIMIPFLILLTPIAELVFFLMVMSLPLVIHCYMYLLYRELL